MRHLESDLQIAAVQWFQMQYPQYNFTDENGNRYSLLFAIPNGGNRNTREGARLKKEGVIPGVLDLLLAIPKKGFHGLFLETKSEKGRLSSAQTIMITMFEEQNYMTHVYKSLDEFMKLVVNYLR